MSGGLAAPEQQAAPVDSEVIVSTQFGGLSRADSQITTGTSTVTDETVEVVPAPAVNPTPAPTPAVRPPAVALPPNVDTLSAQNIYTNRATFRGSIEFPSESFAGAVRFYYSENRSDVINKSDDVDTLVVSNRTMNTRSYDRIVSGLNDDTTYYYQFCFTADTVICGDTVMVTTVEEIDSNYRLPTASTQRAEDINAETATLRGTYRRNSADSTTAFFVYGESRDLVNEVSVEYEEYRDIDEQGDALQKVRVGISLDASGSFSREIDDLERRTVYYHRFCIAYDDAETGIRCGGTYSFETKSRQRDVPEIRGESDRVSGTTATLSANLDMEDYINGHAFLVYGTSESRINSVANVSRFSSVSQSGDSIQRVSIDADFDGSDDVSIAARDLISSDYYYRFCIQYEAENDFGSDQLYVVCGDVGNFTVE